MTNFGQKSTQLAQIWQVGPNWLKNLFSPKIVNYPYEINSCIQINFHAQLFTHFMWPNLNWTFSRWKNLMFGPLGPKSIVLAPSWICFNSYSVIGTGLVTECVYPLNLSWTGEDHVPTASWLQTLRCAWWLVVVFSPDINTEPKQRAAASIIGCHRI